MDWLWYSMVAWWIQFGLVILMFVSFLFALFFSICVIRLSGNPQPFNDPRLNDEKFRWAVRNKICRARNISLFALLLLFIGFCIAPNSEQAKVLAESQNKVENQSK